MAESPVFGGFVFSRFFVKKRGKKLFFANAGAFAELIDSKTFFGYFAFCFFITLDVLFDEQFYTPSNDEISMDMKKPRMLIEKPREEGFYELILVLYCAQKGTVYTKPV